MVFPPGVFITTMPRFVAAGTSTLSKPEPARPMTFRFFAAAITSLVTLVPLRIIKPSYWPISSMSCAGVSFVLISTESPPFSKMVTPCAERESLINTFIVYSLLFFVPRPTEAVIIAGGHAPYFFKRISWAMPTPVPNFSGCPIPFNTISMADTAIMTSNVSIYPILAIRKTFPLS